MVTQPHNVPDQRAAGLFPGPAVMAKSGLSGSHSGWIIAPLVAMIIGLAVHFSPAGTLINNRLLEWRMSSTTLPASGSVVFVAIDSRSLYEVGTWPWSRSIHADILDQLTAAGASDVLFDIDFAFPSDAEGDAAFADSLNRAGGATYLAAFAQPDSIEPDAPLTYNLPFQPFRDASWPAMVNVVSDKDSLIRRYLSGTNIDGEFVPSAAMLFAGGAMEEGAQFEINYSISPSSIPSLSAVDVARGDFPTDAVKGHAVIVGAAAVELGDYFAVPLHQVIPGALIHATATETLLLDASISRSHAHIVALVLALFVLVLKHFIRQRPWHLIGVTLCAACATEIAGLVLFQTTYISLPTAFAHPALFGFVLTKLATSLGLNTLLLLRRDLQAKNTHALLTHLFDQSSDGIVIVDSDGHTLMQSRSAEDIFGTNNQGSVLLPAEIRSTARSIIPMSEVQQINPKPHSLLLGEDSGARSIEYLATPSVFHELGPRHSNTLARRITAISARDVTDLKRQERKIAYFSTHDERTGAIRRRPFVESLRIRMQANEPTAVFVLNLHRFKIINLTLGRDVGDEVLAEVVCRLQSLDGGLSAIARLDGDSFAFFVEQFTSECDVAELAQDVWTRVCEPYAFALASAQIGARIGYFEVTQPTTATAEDALRRAEDALDAARSSDVSDICSYDPADANQRERVRAVERAMLGSIQRNELYVVYQPQHRLTDGALIGVEALVRWESPVLGQIFPDEFIPIAESNGFIAELGRFVLFQAARDATELPEQVTMAVNVSSIQFKHSDLQNDVSEILAQTGLAPARLCLELTESVLLTQDTGTIETMQDIAWTGVTWAMDDFGTGFSSMAYLSSLPLSKIKLDRSFTMALDSDPTARVILRSVITLCDGLGINLLCEGVETEQHLEILLEEGCVEGQGYYFGRPQSHDNILEKLHNRSGERALN